MSASKNLSEADHLKIYGSACLIDIRPSWNEIAQAAYELASKRAADRIAEHKRENAELRESEHESEALRMSLSDKLTRIAVAVKGEPPPLTLWGWDDLPELVAELRSERERLKYALETIGWTGLNGDEAETHARDALQPKKSTK